MYKICFDPCLAQNQQCGYESLLLLFFFFACLYALHNMQQNKTSDFLHPLQPSPPLNIQWDFAGRKGRLVMAGLMTKRSKIFMSRDKVKIHKSGNHSGSILSRNRDKYQRKQLKDLKAVASEEVRRNGAANYYFLS